jgi:endoglucanase
LTFQVGGKADPYTLCLDDISLRGGYVKGPYDPDVGSPVRINQDGYLTHGPKNGTFVTDKTTALPFTVNAADGSQVASGSTKPFGTDPSSKKNVQTFDFSQLATVGKGYTVTIDGKTSEPFAVGDDVYSQLRKDSLSFFYQQRSGIAIDGNLVGAKYARPAGHIGVAPNQGDTSVPCVSTSPCAQPMNLVGGWYDAGDQGKYVVNGGIAVSQLMSSWERTLTEGDAPGNGFRDGQLQVPEKGNGVPDVLDEARWELEWMLKMQVPGGEPLAGMVHHKMNDDQWTGLPMRPEQDPRPRLVYAPSTAATLNFAAAAAQGARLFKPYDPAFADELLSAATTAWTAAQAHPAMYFNTDNGGGGGGYGDNNVTDEFYWAGAELFITTGQDTYRQAVLTSPLYGDTNAVFPRGGMSWGDTAGLGEIALATVPNTLTADQLAAVRSTVTHAADGYAADAKATAYGLPFQGKYVWGSNSQILNNGVVLGTAYDLTGDTAYRNAALSAMDYVLGRNAMNQSYVTGYGTRYSKNEHHRFWAHELDDSLPNPPAGSIAGGPNEDETTGEDLGGCAPAMCYIDDIEKFTVNEVAINWNSALAWMASFADDMGATDNGSGDGGSGGATGGTTGGTTTGGTTGGTTTGGTTTGGTTGGTGDASCSVDVSSNRWGGGFVTNVTVHNNGSAAVSPWKLTWSYSDDQKITSYWSSTIAQSGQAVTATPLDWNQTIPAAGSVDFGFQGNVTGTGTDPTSFSLNGKACTSR